MTFRAKVSSASIRRDDPTTSATQFAARRRPSDDGDTIPLDLLRTVRELPPGVKSGPSRSASGFDDGCMRMSALENSAECFDWPQGAQRRPERLARRGPLLPFSDARYGRMRQDSSRYPSRISARLARIETQTTARGHCSGSFRIATAMMAANSTLDSRSAATSGIGATVMAQIAIQ